ncbi:PdaC/SigV domain-containing protein [Qipengyuania sp. ASV99]|uniref:PdaC/SigV domain-containing protein n=1 Tax=Qipengyuania sp. ASV99 TaxID=3399681 RepID=UPI003A4C839E
MIKPLDCLFAAGILPALIACSSPQDMGEEIAVEEGETAQSVLERRTAAGAKAVAFEDNAESSGGGAREFAYGWPAQVSAIPALAEMLTAQRDAALTAQKSEWEASLAEFAGEECISCTSRGFGKQWEVVADLPRFLSLSAQSYIYSGGAHGNSDFDALVWDRESARAFTPAEMFASTAALDTAVREDYCAALEDERRERRGEYYSANDDVFGDCPGVEELTVLVGSSTGREFDRIGLLAAPYVAGAYAEGPYEVTLPVTAQILAAVRPEYRAAFAAPE